MNPITRSLLLSTFSICSSFLLTRCKETTKSPASGPSHGEVVSHETERLRLTLKPQAVTRLGIFDNVSGTVRAGNQLPNMPKYAASLWKRFDPVEQFGAGFGVIYQGKGYYLYAHTNNNITPGSPAAVKAGVKAKF